MKIRAFTLIELLTVISIIAVLAAILFPVFIATRAAAYQTVASGAVNELDKAMIMYCGDNDDTYMPAMYFGTSGFQAWYGLWSANHWVPNTGLLSTYERKTLLRDYTAKYGDYLGDHSGFGYNWGFIGSDFHVTNNYKTFPNCHGMPTSSSLANPSNAVVFATSGFYSAPWLNGDGNMYDFGFVDPVAYCKGNPNVDFRHIVQRVVNLTNHSIQFPGNALVAMSDGHVKSFKIGELSDTYFTRDGKGFGPALDGSKLP